MNNSTDQIYADKPAAPGEFKFDARVARVFSDMISRSVPGYDQILNLLPTLVRQFKQDDGLYYDIGCSLGAGMLAMTQGLDRRSRIIGIDNSEPMLKQAEIALSSIPEHDYSLLCEDATNSSISNAAMVLMNFTLQFIPLEQRSGLIANIYRGLKPGGVLVLSEKIKFKNTHTNTTLIDIYHQYKADQGYSQLEIARKRDAIENVLIPETLLDHIQRLNEAGFTVVTPWIQNLQFVSILAIK